MEPENNADAKKDPPPPPTPATSSSSSSASFSGFASSGSSLFDVSSFASNASTGSSFVGVTSNASTGSSFLGVTSDAFPSWSSMRSPNASISLFNGFSGFGGTTFSPSHNSTSRNGNVTFGASSSSMLFPVSTLSSAPTPSGIFSSFDLNRGTRHRRMEPVRESRDNHSYVMHISATSAFVDSQPEMLRAADYKKGDRCGTGYRPTIPVLGESSQSPALFNSVDAAFPPAAPPVYTSGFASNSASGFTFGGGHPFATTQGTSRTFPAPGLTAQASLGQHLQNFPGMDHLPTMCFEHVENMIINFYAGSAPSPQRQSISTENISEALPPARTDAQPSGSNPEQSEPTFTLGQSRPSAEQSSSDVSSSRTQPSSNASKAAFTGPQNEQDH